MQWKRSCFLGWSKNKAATGWVAALSHLCSRAMQRYRISGSNPRVLPARHSMGSIQYDLSSNTSISGTASGYAKTGNWSMEWWLVSLCPLR